jgi:hypothetical protein
VRARCFWLRAWRGLASVAAVGFLAGAFSLTGWRTGFVVGLLLAARAAGQVLQLRREGIDASRVILLPLRNPLTSEAASERPDMLAVQRIALAGPLAGSLGAAAVFALAAATDSAALRLVAAAAFAWELVAVLPFEPLDGGMVDPASRLWPLVLAPAAMVGAVLIIHHWAYPVLVILAAVIAWGRLQLRCSHEAEGCIDPRRAQFRWLQLALIAGLAGAVVLAV